MRPGESKSVTLTIDPLYLSVLNASIDRSEILPGEYKVMAGGSSALLPLSVSVKLDGSK
jgi:beta-glucosidase